MKEWKQNMNASDDFVADDFEEDVQDDFVADDTEELYSDPVSEKLRAAGIEPDDEFDRAAAAGLVEGGKDVLSGATMGLSEYVPGLKTKDNAASLVGKTAGAFLPIEASLTAGKKLVAEPIAKLATKVPMIEKQVAGFGRLMGLATGGGTYGAVEEAIKDEKPPSTEDFLMHGATWAAIDLALGALGWTGRFAKGLYDAAKKTGSTRTELLNKTAQELIAAGVDATNPERVAAVAMTSIEAPMEKVAVQEGEQIAKQAIDLKDKKVSPQVFDKVKVKEPKSYIPKEFDAVEVLEQQSNKAIDESIEAIGERAPSEKQLGENIKADLDANMKKLEDEYTPAYELAEEEGQFKFKKTNEPSKTATLGKEIIENIEAFSTTKAGSLDVLESVENVLQDVGFKIVRDAEGKLQEVLSTKEVSASKLMELARRLNSNIKYGSLDKKAQDMLKPLVQAIKQDAKTALGEGSNALEMYEKAEADFAKKSNVYGKESIRKIRKMKAGERVAEIIRKPSALADLKEAVSPQQFSQIERELLEHMKTLKEDKARALYREIRPSLTEDAQAVSERLLESKTPVSSPSRKAAIRQKTEDAILNDFSKSTVTGERPDTALKLWKTSEGQQLVKNALKDNPNKAEILKYLEEQSFKDMTASVVNKEGEINFQKLKEFMKDPASVENVRMLGGDDAVNFFKNLETLAARAEKNASRIEGILDVGSAKERKRVADHLTAKGKEKLAKTAETNQPYKYLIDKFFDKYGVKTKMIFALLGFKGGFMGVATNVLAIEAIEALVKNKPLRNAIRKASGPKTDPIYLINAYEDINSAMNND